ncbi:DUF721 domain-containing protein [Pseudoruegeria sp. HB172150]|uniref:DUF721 domain-containing protein n=1 Tax=Pseudoruegeria sp. HB172150 TaxID=2721164 RepID=UPI001557ADF3|nr:DUF721 domain-containing protein [Pseudoruegeria sp. HB172150]
MTGPTQKAPRRLRGFERASGLLSTRIREAGEKRGFAISRVLTHWGEIVGEDTAAIALPVNVSYARGGFGATLTVLTTGANAPMLEMQKERMRERVNACYGYSAISRIRITQTAPTGFAEGQAQFAPAPKAEHVSDPEIAREAQEAARPVADEGLRQALEALGENVLSRHRQS